MFSTIVKNLLFLSLKKRPKQLLKNKENFEAFMILSKNAQVTGDVICRSTLSGLEHLRDARLNKGLAFTLEERQALGIHGLLAASFRTQAEQVELARVSFDRYEDNLNRYIYLTELQDRNEKLFYSLLDQDIKKYLPIVYTPTVGYACQLFGLIYKRPRGLFISINDKGHILDILKNWPEYDVKAICFTDGERILGLGDLGAYGMCIPVGKLALYTALAAIMPHQCLPITLDVGTNNKELLEDPLYVGLRRERVRGKEYDEFLDEFMLACTQIYGPNVLLQFEDFALENAVRLLAKYKDHYCTFNDDIQGTASAAAAGLMSSTRVTKKRMSDYVYLFLGAGSAASGIGNLCVYAMMEEGMKKEEAEGRIYMFDLDGLLSNKRPNGVPKHAKNFGKDIPPEKDFEKCVAQLKPSVLIGCSTATGAFTPKILKIMAQNHERPVVFALSNPTAKAECTAQACYDNTEGRCVFASGSPFPPVKYNGKEYITGQGNNAYIFPGLALGVIAAKCVTIPECMFLIAAQTVAKFVRQEDLDKGSIYPPLDSIKELSIEIAIAVMDRSYKEDIATVYPRPKDLRKYITNMLYHLEYQSYLPHFFKYPECNVKIKPMSESLTFSRRSPNKSALPVPVK